MSLAIAKEEANTVEARVVIFNLGKRNTVTLILSKTPAGWRIADVANADMKSLMGSLQNEIAHSDN